MKRELASFEDIAWYWYIKEGLSAPVFNKTDNVGKFMTFVEGEVSDELQLLILKAIEEGVTKEVKHTSPVGMELNPHGNGNSSVVIWYSTDDKEPLQKLARFLVDNGLVQKTKAGKLYNISFKFDSQTRAGEYGDTFNAPIKLGDLMDLTTGEFY